MPTINATFQDRLRYIMDVRGISVRELSEKTGINRTTLYLYRSPCGYNRGTCLGANNLEALADVLDVSMDWLWGRTDEPIITERRDDYTRGEEKV